MCRNLAPYLPNSWLRTVNQALVRAYVLVVRCVLSTRMIIAVVVSEYGNVCAGHVVKRIITHRWEALRKIYSHSH